MLFDAKKAAEVLGVTENTLCALRVRGTGCPTYRNGNRVYYDERDLAEFSKVRGAFKGGNAPRQVYKIKVYREGELVNVVRRRACSLNDAVEELACYPSFEGCEFKLAPEAKVTPSQVERFRMEFDQNRDALRDAFIQSAHGLTACERQAGSNAARRIFDSMVKRCFR